MTGWSANHSRTGCESSAGSVSRNAAWSTSSWVRLAPRGEVVPHPDRNTITESMSTKGHLGIAPPFVGAARTTPPPQERMTRKTVGSSRRRKFHRKERLVPGEVGQVKASSERTRQGTVAKGSYFLVGVAGERPHG